MVLWVKRFRIYELMRNWVQILNTQVKIRLRSTHQCLQYSRVMNWWVSSWVSLCLKKVKVESDGRRHNINFLPTHLNMNVHYINTTILISIHTQTQHTHTHQIKKKDILMALSSIKSLLRLILLEPLVVEVNQFFIMVKLDRFVFLSLEKKFVWLT